jgi:hypothetical protein
MTALKPTLSNQIHFISKSVFEFGGKLRLCYCLLFLFADTSGMHIEDFTSQKVQGEDIT